MVDWQYVIVIIFVTLGPLKIIGPYLQLTARFDAPTKRSLANRGILVAAITGIIVIFAGDFIRTQWGVSKPDLMITFGILILIASLDTLKTAQEPVAPPTPPDDPDGLGMSPIAFPMIITPYGIAALLAFAAMAPGKGALFMLCTVFLGIMVLNYLAMLFAKQILTVLHPKLLRVVGWVLAVLQASLAVVALTAGLQQGLLSGTPVGGG